MIALKLKVKDQYGQRVFYPMCVVSDIFAQMLGTKTLTVRAINHIKALGYTIEFVHEEVTL